MERMEEKREIEQAYNKLDAATIRTQLELPPWATDEEVQRAFREKFPEVCKEK